MTTHRASHATWALAGNLFQIACNAFFSRDRNKDERAPYQESATVALIFSAAAVEAFINEMAVHSRSAVLETSNPPGESTEPKSVIRLAELLEEAERSKGSTQLKYLLAGQALSDIGFVKGRNPYQDFNDLMDLRNAIVHLKMTAEELDWGDNAPNLPKPIARMSSKKVLADPTHQLSWFHKLQTRAVARWACETAKGIVIATLDSVPSGRLHDKLEFYRKTFSQALD